MSTTFDNHLLYSYTNGLTEEQMVQVLVKTIQYFETQSKASGCEEKIDSTFRINIVRDQDDEPIGYAWIYVSDTKLYHLLSGNNIDGTERIEIITQENPMKPSIPFEEKWVEVFEKEKILKGYSEDDWALDSLEEQVKTRIQNLYEDMKIERHLPTLMPLQNIEVQDEEGNTMMDKTITIARGKLTYPSSYYYPNQLRNATYSKIPKWFTKEMLYEIFRPYVSDPSDTKYPIIRMLKDRCHCEAPKFSEGSEVHKKNCENADCGDFYIVFIEYDRDTTDGIVALNMTKKLYIRDPEGNRKMFAFNFAQKTRNKRSY